MIILTLTLILALTLTLTMILITIIPSLNNQKGGSNNEQCLCENKFSTKNLLKTITGTKLVKSNKNDDTDTDTDTDIDLINVAKKKQLPINSNDLCNMLIASGFNKNWNIDDIYRLSQTDMGRNLLRKYLLLS